MTNAIKALPRELANTLEQRVERVQRACLDAGVKFHDDAGVDERLRKVLLASDFASVLAEAASAAALSEKRSVSVATSSTAISSASSAWRSS